MDARVDCFGDALAGRVMKHLNPAGAAVRTAVPVAAGEPVRIRAGRIDGCGFRTDTHTEDALAAGENQQRLNLVATWHEATVFTGAERGADRAGHAPRGRCGRAGSRTRSGRTSRSTTTRTGSPR